MEVVRASTVSNGNQPRNRKVVLCSLKYRQLCTWEYAQASQLSVRKMMWRFPGGDCQCWSAEHSPPASSGTFLRMVLIGLSRGARGKLAFLCTACTAGSSLLDRPCNLHNDVM